MNNQELLSGRDDVINDLETQLRERKLENEVNFNVHICIYMYVC